jgi:y4mF family transcriptional regulator
MKIHTIKQLGELILKTRKLQKLTQEQLAMSCGVGIRFIREIENGKESCHIGKVFHVLKMLGLEIQVENE